MLDQRFILLLHLQEQVGPGVDEEIIADRTPDRLDPPALQLERMQPLVADPLVLEVAADRARFLEPRNVAPALLRIGRISAFEIDGQRQVDRIDDPLRIGEGEVDRHLLPVGPAIGVGHRMAPGRQRLRPRFHHGKRAADVPDIVEHDRIARHVQRRESFELAAHSGAGPFCCQSSTFTPSGSMIQAKRP